MWPKGLFWSHLFSFLCFPFEEPDSSAPLHGTLCTVGLIADRCR